MIYEDRNANVNQYIALENLLNISQKIYKFFERNVLNGYDDYI